MIGNDIVDLALAEKESNWKRKGYLDKVFTQHEQSLISNAPNPTIMVWNLWSRKEAAYKIYNRETGIRGYFPLQFVCLDLDTIDGIIFGKVVIKSRIYYTKTEITSEFINTIAVENIQYFDSIKTCETRKNSIKTNGIPNYLDKENSDSSPVSISHHGRFERIISL